MPGAALRLLAMAEAGALDELECARADLLRGQIAFAVGDSEASTLLLDAAKKLEPLDVELARETYLEALWAASLAGPSTCGGLAREAAQAARAAPAAPDPPRAVDLLLDGRTTEFTDGYAAAIPTLKRALTAFRGPNLPGEGALRWFWLACATASHLWDDETWEVLATRQLRLAREAGALGVLPQALNTSSIVHASFGELTAAAALAEEHAAVTEATGSPVGPYGALVLAAWRGCEGDVEKMSEVIVRGCGAMAAGSRADLTVTAWAKALMYNSFGRYEDALAAALPATEHLPEIGATFWGAQIELIEAASRSGTPERAGRALRRLTESTHASGTDWALGIQAHARALYSDGPAAETAHREAIDRLGRTRLRGQLARAHLVYGEWLRRKNRRLEARAQLRIAHEMFTAMGADAFARRATRELLASGDVARKPTVQTSGALTAQEVQIARLVGEHLTNPEIAAQLFISPRTVEWHLNKIFTKLNITSRRQLHHGRRP
jgi:DNA-binding CsgD family transcriptional regulator/tetratricopeptide (TPR) repeat protein